MKVLLLTPKVYSLSEMLSDGFNDNGWKSCIVDYKYIISNKINRIYEKTAGLPRKITKSWKSYYYRLINNEYNKIFDIEKPNIVLIYNNQFIFPETIERFKKSAKIVFYLGDNPLWSKTFDYNLNILKYADLILSPDSHWQFELKMIGIPNVECDHIGYSRKRFFIVSNIPETFQNRYKSDLIFIGRNYLSSPGYKRTIFLNKFSGMSMKIFGGNSWNYWLKHFPELKQHYNMMQHRISDEELNYAINCAKIYPIDQNPGIINGIHVRVFEAIGAGALPIMEWRKDIDKTFNGLLPVIKNYNEARRIAEYYLQSEDIREKKVEELKNYLNKVYTPSLYVKRLISYLNI